MLARVIEYSSSSYAREPGAFFIEGRRIRVSKIERSWIEETVGLEGLRRRVWQVVDEDGKRRLLVHYLTSDFWEIEA